jgi:enoyl-CoA hydratase/carnithine racemase
MTYTTIAYGVAEGVATLRFNRPERMNAIDGTMYDETKDAVRKSIDDAEVRVLVLTGTGERAFCVGADLQARGKDRPTSPERVRERNLHPERTLNGMLLSYEKPLIAAVNGAATGGGLAFAMAADIIYAADSARFGTAHAKLGVPLLDMLGHTLPRRLGPGRAAELAFTGRIIDAAEALSIGLVDKVVPSAELAGTAAALAREIAETAPLSLYFSKLALRRSTFERPDEYARFERYVFNLAMASDDAKEAMLARREKRKPVYRGS